MAEAQTQVARSVEAGTDLALGTAVKRSSGTVIATAAITDLPYGFVRDSDVKAGETAAIVIGGRTLAIAGDTITDDAILGVNDSGQVVPIEPGTDATQYVVGRALEAAASGELVYIEAVLPVSRAA